MSTRQQPDKSENAESKTPRQAPEHDFYMPAMPPIDLIEALVKNFREKFLTSRSDGPKGRAWYRQRRPSAKR